MMRNIDSLEETYGEEVAGNIIRKLKKYSFKYSLAIKILSVNPSEVYVSIAQVNADAKKIFDRDELAEIIHDLFDENILPSQELKMSIHTIEVSPLRDIDVEWVKRRMYQTSTKISQMSKDLGIPKTTIDAYLKSNAPFNKLEKGVFFYYLEYRNLLKQANTTNKSDEDLEN
jgi:hypothetical protein